MMYPQKESRWKNLPAFVKFIRLPNVIIVILTQFLLRYTILAPLLYEEDTEVMTTLTDFSLLVLATVLVTIGANIINDYFDVKIDRINRPELQVVGRLVSLKKAMWLHLLLSGIGVLLGFYLSWRIRLFSFGFIFLFGVVLLWLYSAKYKYMLLWGNLIVALCSAMVIMMVFLFEFFWLRLHTEFFSDVMPEIFLVFRIILAYSLFAFLVSLFREIIKDMEDIKGDKAGGCRTLPLVAGMKISRWTVTILIAGTMAFLGYAQLVLYHLGMMPAFWFLLVTCQFTMGYMIYRIFSSNTKEEFHILSNICKIVMFAGILSMLLISINK